MGHLATLLRPLRHELASRQARAVPLREVAEGTGINRVRLTALELGTFDQIRADEVDALLRFYSAGLGRDLGVADLLVYRRQAEAEAGQGQGTKKNPAGGQLAAMAI